MSTNQTRTSVASAAISEQKRASLYRVHQQLSPTSKPVGGHRRQHRAGCIPLSSHGAMPQASKGALIRALLQCHHHRPWASHNPGILHRDRVATRAMVVPGLAMPHLPAIRRKIHCRDRCRIAARCSLHKWHLTGAMRVGKVGSTTLPKEVIGTEIRMHCRLLDLPTTLRVADQLLGP